MRLSAINLAGTARTEVAVGTSSDDVMFFTTAAATPRRGVVVSPLPSAAWAAFATFAALAATMSSGVAVVVGRDGAALLGGSTDSLPPARAGALFGCVEVGFAARVVEPGPLVAAGAAARRTGAGGGGG